MSWRERLKQKSVSGGVDNHRSDGSKSRSHYSELVSVVSLSPRPLTGNAESGAKEPESTEQFWVGGALAELSSAVLKRAGVRFMEFDGVSTVGVWSDLDTPEVRAAVQALGGADTPVRYLDDADIPLRYKVRGVAGEPVPSHVLAAVQSATAEPWRVRDAMLRNSRDTQREKTRCH